MKLVKTATTNVTFEDLRIGDCFLYMIDDETEENNIYIKIDDEDNLNYNCYRFGRREVGYFEEATPVIKVDATLIYNY